MLVHVQLFFLLGGRSQNWRRSHQNGNRRSTSRIHSGPQTEACVGVYDQLLLRSTSFWELVFPGGLVFGIGSGLVFGTRFLDILYVAFCVLS